MGYILDTNVVIDYVAERYLPQQLLQLDAIVDEALNISIITKIEALGYNGDSLEMVRMASFIQVATIFSLTDEVAAQTIVLRKARKMKTPDAIIAATALVHGLTLLSRNLSDFKNIVGLAVIDPYGL